MRKCGSIWSSRRGRTLLPQEALVTQGFPAIDIEGLSERLSMPFAIEGSKENLFACVGNGINMFA
eukprot:870369-Alexandrium_andersonii.AAC.1